MLHITHGLQYEKNLSLMEDKTIHLIVYEQNVNHDLTLLLSKVSEAILPNIMGNHIGDGAYMDKFLEHQNGVRFIINGGFNHYRKNFYAWQHQNFNVGDPVGLVKIRDHLFEDYISLEHYGFFIQETKQALWDIVQKENINKKDKYILGCTPLLMFNSLKIDLPIDIMQPMKQGLINPPSVLGHGLQNHPRTAIGMKNNTIYFINVEGHHNDGCSLLELQQLGLDLNLDSLLNLDGGGSSQFRLMNNKSIIKNEIDKEDEKRILGHVLVVFDNTLLQK